MSTGCAACHNGVTVGGQMYQKFGVTQDYWTLTGSEEIDLFKGRDKGRFQDTKNEADAFIFKVQQLRNVAVTPPYFHDGSVAELGDAVRIMAKLQLGRDLSRGRDRGHRRVPRQPDGRGAGAVRQRAVVAGGAAYKN